MVLVKCIDKIGQKRFKKLIHYFVDFQEYV